MNLNEKTAKAAASWWGERLQSGDKAKFEASICKSVLDELNQYACCYLNCDYDPQGMVLEAVHAAGLECQGEFFSARGILPEKHSMEITPGLLRPKEGYGNWTDPIVIHQ